MNNTLSTSNHSINAGRSTGRRFTRAAMLAGGVAIALGASTLGAGGASAGGFGVNCTGKTFFAQHNGQTLNGTCGNDLFKVGQYTNVTINAGDGDDDIRAGWGGGVVTVFAGNGNDSVSNGSDKRVVVYGEAGNDSIEGGSYDDTIYGGSGHDDIFGGNGKDALYGEGGDDTLNADSYGVLLPAYIDGGSGTDFTIVDAGVDVYVNVEGQTTGNL